MDWAKVFSWFGPYKAAPALAPAHKRQEPKPLPHDPPNPHKFYVYDKYDEVVYKVTAPSEKAAFLHLAKKLDRLPGGGGLRYGPWHKWDVYPGDKIVNISVRGGGRKRSRR